MCSTNKWRAMPRRAALFMSACNGKRSLDGSRFAADFEGCRMKLWSLVKWIADQARNEKLAVIPESIRDPWLLGCVVVGALLSAGAALALQVTDDRGVTLTFAQPPQRIVSLLPALTE